MLNYRMITYQIDTIDGPEWVAEFPALPGLLGTSKDFNDAILDLEANALVHIGFLRELGKKVPEEDAMQLDREFTGKILLRVSKSLHKFIIETSEAEGISANALINESLNRYIGVKESSFEVVNSHLDAITNKKYSQFYIKNKIDILPTRTAQIKANFNPNGKTTYFINVTGGK